MRAGCVSVLVTLGASIALTACGGTNSASVPVKAAAKRLTASSSPIAHVVVMVQENRTFNNFFATYPGADGTTTAAVVAQPSCSPPILAGTISLTKTDLILPYDLNHKYAGFKAGFDKGKMDGFDKIKRQNNKPECYDPLVYTDPSQIQPYWILAEQYVLAEHMFTTHGSSSFVAHQDLIRGDTQISSQYELIDDPTSKKWGCDAKPSTKTSLITTKNKVLVAKGPFPCSNAFPNPYGYDTLRDLLDAQGISWKYYVPKLGVNYGNILDAFDVIAPVRYGPEWNTNVVSPETTILDDISNGLLPAVSWVIPSEPDSDHPGESVDRGPAWVAGVVNAIGESQYWNSTAIVIVWDDWGGLYDNVPPPQYGFGELGFRVPALIVSPYAKAGHISTTTYEFGSILRYIEENWNLGYLDTTDTRANSLIDAFDYNQQPIQFQPIPSEFSKAYFLHQKPAQGPPDTDL
jgi:phospholipase C